MKPPIPGLTYRCDYTRHNPFTGALYAFTNRRRNKIKCLMWEDNGFVLYYKALAEEK
ncbi:IS66 family insertion sequence element accessory protein TnpB, partial [Aeromonas caviae]